MNLSSLVVVEWRDSFCDTGQRDLPEISDDCRWVSIGWIVRMTDLFLTITSGLQLSDIEGGQFDSPLSIPWTQVVRAEVLEWTTTTT